MVKVLFDTSVLVSALWVDHPVHSACIYWLQQSKRGNIKGVIVSHTLAELYSTLTALPIKPRISCGLAQQLITDNLGSCEVISLTVDDYKSVINQMVTLNLTGGAIYDSLIAHAALKAEVDQLLTLNSKHFTRLGEQIAQLITVPH